MNLSLKKVLIGALSFAVALVVAVMITTTKTEASNPSLVIAKCFDYEKNGVRIFNGDRNSIVENFEQGQVKIKYPEKNIYYPLNMCSFEYYRN